MNAGIEEKNQAFDHDMRRLHAEAVSNISPSTLARLRAARHGAQSTPRQGHAWRWVAATAFSAVLAVVLGMQLLPGPVHPPVARPVVVDGASAGDADALATLDESPDLYMWLASSEAEPLAME